MILSEKVSEKLDTDLIQEIRMRTPSTESGGKFKGKGKFGKKDKGKGKNPQLDQGAQVTEWKPENWKWNNWTEKGQQKGFGKKGKGEKKGKEWRAPSPQRQPAFASSQFDNKSATTSLDSIRVKGFSFFFVPVQRKVVLRILGGPIGNSSRNVGRFCNSWALKVR